jgi:hypothetical protein
MAMAVPTVNACVIRTDIKSINPALRFYTSGAFSIDSPTPTLWINLNERTIFEEKVLPTTT